jgi:ribonuclease M5
MKRIEEIIIVEGRADERAVKAAVDAEVIVTSGFGISKETWDRIQRAYQGPGILVLTDPDHAGEEIRKRISRRFPDAGHCFLSREDATAGNDIGVENASTGSIIKALEKARCRQTDQNCRFSASDLSAFGMVGVSEAADRRDAMGKALGIGYGNARTFLRRLNSYGVTKEEYYNHGKTLFSGDRT